jgi:NAD+ synthase (glutamine-hydrolysing)
MRSLRLALAQMNPTVGDLPGNVDRIIALVHEAQDQQADVVAFPELAITGYPPEDLLLKGQFLAEADQQLERIATACADVVVVVGVPHLVDGPVFNAAKAEMPDAMTGALYNAAAILSGGRVVDRYHKIFLPNYGVFDERRYFSQGDTCPVYEINGIQVGVSVCEDLWHDNGPTTVQRSAGSELILNINASPYHQLKGVQREAMVTRRAIDNGVFVAYLNMVGGQDELVFDGQSIVVDPAGTVVARGPQFEEALLIVDIDADEVGPTPAPSQEPVPVGRARNVHVSGQMTSASRELVAASISEPLDELTEVYRALVLGTSDYVKKSGFPGALIGLSGGIDSALTVAIAAQALGAENVTALFMPSQYTEDQSNDDSVKLTNNLGVHLVTLPIKGLFTQYLDELAPLFEVREPDTTEENLQARIRGNLLMAASNKFGWMVLTTGNKSEMATGYATLYGDMAGGFAVIKDVPKTLVTALSRHVNVLAGREIIPESIIVRPPTAELRPDQKDEDSLPPYAVLDRVIEAYVERDWSVPEMLEAGLPANAIELTVRLVDRSEYKRRQAPPGIVVQIRAKVSHFHLEIRTLVPSH